MIKNRCRILTLKPKRHQNVFVGEIERGVNRRRRGSGENSNPRASSSEFLFSIDKQPQVVAADLLEKGKVGRRKSGGRENVTL